MRRRSVRVAIISAILSLGVLATQARAAGITLAPGTTTSFDVDWSLFDGFLGGLFELSALGEFTVTVDGSGDYADFLIKLTNESIPLWNERVHSIGFNLDPNPVSLTNPIAGDVFDNFALSQKFPGYKTIDICAWTDNNCSGGAQGKNLAAGASDTFGFTLNGNFDQGLKLDTFAIKFQGTLGSYEFTGTPVVSVPEYESSASFLLVGLGFVLAFSGWRRLNPSR